MFQQIEAMDFEHLSATVGINFAIKVGGGS